ncbi:MAG: DedA family protein [Spartobacteria bacterium]|nr:DedA family protein [Spartobacteria bacterium]
MIKHPSLRWGILITLIFAGILIPFFLFETQITELTQHVLHQSASHPVAAWFFIFFLLASDIILPIPSSLASTAGSAALGFGWGLLASWMGMNISCLIGYAIGRFGRTTLRQRFLTEHDIAKLDALYQHWGNGLIIVTRPAPVLAETVMLFAGMSRMPLRLFTLLCVLSNLGISAVYAGLGATSTETDSFLLAFAGAMLLPLIAMLVMRCLKKKTHHD